MADLVNLSATGLEESAPKDDMTSEDDLERGPYDGVSLEDDLDGAPSDDFVPEDDLIEEVLSELNYRAEFTSWIEVFWWLCEPALGGRRQHLTDFLNMVQSYEPPMALEPLDMFLQQETNEAWANHDDTISARWDHVVSEISRLSEGTIDTRYLTKPSGPLNATLSFVWHYPTFRSRRVIRGSTHDPSNPSLRWLAKKIGSESTVRVQNRICLRHKYEKQVQWSYEFRNWEAVDREFLALNQWLNSFSKIIIFVGESNCRLDSIRKSVPLQPGEEFSKVTLQVNCHMFGELPYCILVQHCETGKVRQLILLSYHSHAWIGEHLRVVPAIHDCIYNAACEMARFWSDDDFLFSRHAFRVSAAESHRKKSRRFTPASIVSQERKTGIKVTELYIRQNFSVFILKHPQLFMDGIPKRNESYAEGILDIMRRIGHATQAANGYPTLVRGSQLHAARGFPNLKQGRETQAAKGYPNLQQGHTTQAELASRVREAKVAALLRLKQVGELLRRSETHCSMTKTETEFCEIIRSFDTHNAEHCKWFRKVSKKCVFWQPDTPGGLRHDRDGCLEADTFPYAQQDHPAFKLKGQISKEERQKLKVQTADDLGPESVAEADLP